jgi:hypothetical protein
MLEKLAEESNFAALMREALGKALTVYAKRPFGGPEQVLAYLSRYTHRVAIGSGRILALDLEEQTVTFWYKDYADHRPQKQMTLSTVEFLRRFCLHILPLHFVKIRHYGLTGNHHRGEKLAAARAAIAANGSTAAVIQRAELQDTKTVTGTEEPSSRPPMGCPNCGSIRLLLVRHDLPRKKLWLDSS